MVTLSYRNENGLPQFFKEGTYTFKMKVNAEEDHVFVVDQASKDNNCKLDIPGGGEKYYSSICRI